jgi:hypothetical protein
VLLVQFSLLTSAKRKISHSCPFVFPEGFIRAIVRIINPELWSYMLNFWLVSRWSARTSFMSASVEAAPCADSSCSWEILDQRWNEVTTPSLYAGNTGIVSA